MTSDLMNIPGIGVKMSNHLIKAGFPTIASLREVTVQKTFMPRIVWRKDWVKVS